MSDDDLVLAMQTSVKKEVVDHYLGERRIIQEEMQLVFEAASAFHGGMQVWDGLCEKLASALIDKKAAGRFFKMAGLGSPPAVNGGGVGFAKPRALTRKGSYEKLLAGLYRQLWSGNRQLRDEWERVMELRKEVNQDIISFEANYDMLSISAYLRSLDPETIRKSKILGNNFTAAEQALSAQALSFRPISAESLGMANPPGPMTPPKKALKQAQGLIRDVFRDHGQKIETLWAEKGAD